MPSKVSELNEKSRPTHITYVHQSPPLMRQGKGQFTELVCARNHFSCAEHFLYMTVLRDKFWNALLQMTFLITLKC